MTLEEICQKTVEIAKEAGELIETEAAKFPRHQTEIKENKSLVTHVDKSAEKLLVKRLSKLIPCSGFLTEEDTEDTLGDRYRWIIDPIDGTTNFVYGVPAYCVSIGLLDDNVPVAGVIYEISRHECFYAWKDGGAFLNGQRINVADNTNLSEALIGTGFPYAFHEHLEGYMKLWMEFTKRTKGIRRFGAAALDMAFVACGRYDGFYEHRLSPWDVAAGIVIVNEAGGKVSDFHGGDDFLFGGEILASNGHLHDEMLEILKICFREDFK